MVAVFYARPILRIKSKERAGKTTCHA